MRAIVFTGQYKKDLKLARKRNLPEDKLNEVIFKLDQVKYLAIPDSNVVYVRLPELECEIFHETSANYYDDKEVWNNYDNSELKGVVERKIKKQFETEENRSAAMESARHTIERLINCLCGENYEVVFEQNLEKHLEMNIK